VIGVDEVVLPRIVDEGAVAFGAAERVNRGF